MSRNWHSHWKWIGTILGLLILLVGIVGMLFPLFATGTSYSGPSDHSRIRRLSNAVQIYTGDFDDCLPFPGDYRGGKLGRAGSPAWVVAGRSEESGSRSPSCEIQGPVDFCHLADPETGSLFPYAKSLDYFKARRSSNPITPHALAPHPTLDPARIRCSFSMNAALAPHEKPDGSIQPYSLATVEDTAQRIALVLEDPSSATGGRFNPDGATPEFPSSRFRIVRPDKGLGIVGYLDGHAKAVPVEDYQFGRKQWIEFGWNERLQ